MNNIRLPQKPVRQRKGTNALGGKYEAHLAALYAIKCVLDKNIKNFEITSNIEGYGKFDDIIIDVLYNDNSRKRHLLQLKHKEKKRLFTQMLIANKGDFSLHEYEKTYKSLQNEQTTNTSSTDYIILTNADFTPKLEPTPFLQFTEILYEEIPSHNNFLNTLENSKVWKIEQRSEENNLHYDQSFLEHLYLFTNQVHANDIENMVTDLLKIDKEITKLVLNFFENWVEGKKLKHYMLSKKDVEMKLTEIILRMYRTPLFDRVIPDTEEAYKLFNYVVTDYDITSLSAEEKQKVNDAITWKIQNSSMWVKRETLFNNGEDKQIITRRKGEGCSVQQIDFDDIYLAMWEKGEIPLMINSSEANNFNIALDAIIKFTTVKRKFIIFTDTELNTDFTHYRVFENLADLDESKMLRMLQCLKLSLQKREPATHRQFKRSNVILLKLITPNLFTRMAFSEVNCGERISTPDYIIDRCFKKRMVNAGILRDKPNSCLIILNKENQDMFTKVFIPYCHIYQIELTFKLLYLPERSQSLIRYNIMESIKTKEENNSLTHFFFWEPQLIYKGNSLLEWVYSTSDTELISRYLVNFDVLHPEARNFVVEASKALDHYQMPVTIFCNNSGMGKTVTFKHIAKNCSPDIWVVYIDISTSPKSLKDFDENADIITILKSFLCMSKVQAIKEFSCEMFRLKLQDNEVLFLIDSYDVDENQAYKLIEILRKTKNRIWVSTRTCKQQSLEQKLDTVAVQLLGFNRNEAKTAFEAILFQERYDWDPTNTERVLNNITDQLISIPLLVKMLCTIIRQDGNDVFNTKITEIDFYERFMETIDKTNLFIIMKLALTLFYAEEDLKGIIDWVEFEICRDEMIGNKSKQRNFILDGFNEKRPQFLHHSYAEYLAARYLANAYERLPKYKDTFKVLIKQLFHLRNINIRIFFDKLLSKMLPLHDAIIDDDIKRVRDILKQNGTDLLQEKDKFGRTPLHLASSYGKFFMLQDYISIDIINNNSKKCDRNLSITENPNMRRHGDDIFSLILKEQVNTNIQSSLEHKDILEFDVYDFAYECGCLVNLNTLHSYTPMEISFSYNIAFICHCVCNGLNDLLQKINFDCICHVKCNNEYLINTAVKHCSKNIIQTVLDKARCCQHRGSDLNYSNIINKYKLLHSACERQDDQMEGVVSFLFSKGANRFGEGSTISPLHVAAEMNNVQCIKALLSHKFPINRSDHNGMTALHRVCIRDYVDSCSELLMHNIKLEKADIGGNTALHLAAMSSSIRCMRILLQAGAKVETVNKDGYTPLMLAALRANSECVTELLKHGARVNFSIKKRPAAMLVACGGEHIESSPVLGLKISIHRYPDQNALLQTIQILLGNGASIDEIDKEENTAFMLAVKYQQLNIADLLLTHGASIHARNKYGSTALTYAICTENVAYVNMLIEKSVAVTGKDELGNTNIMLALKTKDEVIIGAIMKQENSDFGTVNNEGLTALHVAVQNNLPHWISTLLTRQVPIDKADDGGHTALMGSIILQLKDCFEILVQNGASLKGQTTYGDTVLLLAIRFEFDEIIPTLLKHKVALNTVSEDGFTALSLSVSKGNSNVVNRLLEAGASVNKANQSGYTALMFAAETGSEDLVKMLLEAGADKTKTNNFRQNAYKIAQKRGHLICCDLLKS